MSEQPADNRSLILGAVLNLLAGQGPKGVTLRNVAKQAGVSLGLVRYHYQTRSELFRATLDWVLEQITEMRNSLPVPKNPQEALADFFLFQEKLLLERPDLLTAWFGFVTLGRTDRWVAARVQEHYLNAVETARNFIKETMNSGAKRPDLRPGLTAEDLVASVEGMGLLWLNRADRKGIAAHRSRAVKRWSTVLGLGAKGPKSSDRGQRSEKS